MDEKGTVTMECTNGIPEEKAAIQQHWDINRRSNGEDSRFLPTSLSTNSADYEAQDSDTEEPERMVWGRKMEYILSMLGFCVGLGNVWRFPYVCIRNGGGAFLIPFFICLFLCGLPLFFLEVAMGQFLSKSAYHIWSICPLFRGIGISMNILCLICSWYYIMVLAWTLIYFVNSFKDPLPWTVCGQPWNSPACVPLQGNDPENTTSGPLNTTDAFLNTTALQSDSTMSLMNVSSSLMNASSEGLNPNLSVVALASSYQANATSISSTEEFWTKYVLELSPGLENMDGIAWHVLLALLFSYVLVFVCIIKGVHTVGKVVYVTATLPYILITVLLIKGATLPGAVDGIKFYVKPDFSKLLLVNTWIEAAIQVFYSLGPAWGTLIAMASYNKFNNNCMQDSLLLALVCEGTSVYAGLATFTILGHLAHRLGVHVSAFSKSGAGLVFVVYPEAISYLPVPQLWGVLFFLMLYTLGLDSQFCTIETCLTTLGDTWPRVVRRRDVLFKAAFISLLFLSGIVFTARGGMYLFQLTDWYVGSLTVLTNGVLECIIIGWIYGGDRFLDDIALMIGKRPPRICTYMWKYVTLFLLLIVIAATLIYYEAPVYEGYVFGPGGLLFGWAIALSSFIPLPAYAVYLMVKTKGSIMQRLRKCCAPTDKWVPADYKLQDSYRRDTSHKQSDLPCLRI